MSEAPKSKPKKRRKGPKLRKLQSYANFIVTCRNCGFNYSNRENSCPKCGTKKGELI